MRMRVVMGTALLLLIQFAGLAARADGISVATFAPDEERDSVCAALGRCRCDGFALGVDAVKQAIDRKADYRAFVFVSDGDAQMSPSSFRNAIGMIRGKCPTASVFHYTMPGVKSGLAEECRELFVAEREYASIAPADAPRAFKNMRDYLDHILERGFGTDPKLAGPVRAEAETARQAALDRRTARLHDAKFGVFYHLLYGGASAADWREKVTAFDVTKVADQISACGAGFCFITLMQGHRWMCAPNATYDRICGTKPGEACSERDLPMELADALARRGVDLYLYYTGDGPYKDAQLGPKMGFPPYRNCPVSRDFVENWASVLGEYAMRYGDKVKGWWVDGCYRTAFGYDDELLAIYDRAAKRGNPHALTAYNDGVKNYFEKNYSGEDFTCGEFEDFVCLPRTRYIDGAQAFALIPMGIGPNGSVGWSCPGVRHGKEYLVNFSKVFCEKGGVLCLDVHFAADGTIDADQFDALKAIGRNLGRTIRADERRSQNVNKQTLIP